MSITVSSFGKTAEGKEASLFRLEGPCGLTLVCSDYGCRIVSLLVPDKDGNPGDVVLGHRTLSEYFGENYQGTFVGRYANRIGGGKFSLNGEEFTLAQNDGNNSLHGGPGGYHSVVFAAQVSDGEEPSILFTHTSPDGDEGFPGTLQVSVRYTLTRAGELCIDYAARSDKDTFFNPTNHSFFNLSGDPQKTVFDTRLRIFAGQVTAVSDDLIPDGRFLPVADGPLDFTQGKALGEDMFADDPLIQLCGGFDHNFCVEGSGFRKMAEAYEPDSGRRMEVFSDMPGIQLYTFNKTSGLMGKDGLEMKPHTAFCLETQFYPDSPNRPEFPSCVLRAGEDFASRTVYRFSI